MMHKIETAINSENNLSRQAKLLGDSQNHKWDGIKSEVILFRFLN
jgi:hypothetical protein